MDYYRLKIWQKSRVLVKDIYRVTMAFPKSEQFGLTSQLRRAAVSIVSNIAEGYGRGGNKQFAYFISIAQGSAAEVETQIIIASDLQLIESHESQILLDQIIELRKMLNSFHKVIGKNKHKLSKPH